MESKEINKSESTLTQGTTSKTAFPSNRIFLLSFSLPRDLLHEVFRCTFCTYFLLFFWISLLSNVSSLVCFDFSLMLISFCFWKYTYLHYELFRQRKQKILPLKWLLKICLNIYCDMLLKFTAMLRKDCCLKEVYWFQFVSEACHDHPLSSYAVLVH